MDKHIQVAAWASIIGSIIGIATAINPKFYLDLLSALFGVIATYGFYRIANREKMTLLKIASLLLIIGTIGYVAYDSFATLPWELPVIGEEPSTEEIEKLGESYAALAGAFTIMGILVGFFGYTVLELRNKFKHLALWLGITGIVSGASLILMFGVPVLAGILDIQSEIPILAGATGTFLALPSIAANWILEIILLFRAARKYR